MSINLGNIHLGPMTLVDVPVVHTIEERLFPDDAWSTGLFHSELTQDNRSYVIAADDAGVIVGYAGIMVVGTVADLQTIAVVEDWQGKGVGGMLLRALIDDAVARGATEMFLEVRSDNPAQQMYEHFGFTRIDIRRNYYARGIDAFVMRKPLWSAS